MLKLLAIALSGAQLNLIVGVAVVFAVLFAANAVLFAVFFYKRKKSELCTAELQARREQLLEELHQLQLSAATQGLSEEDLSDEEEADDLDVDEEDESDDVEDDEAAEPEQEDNSASFNAEIMAAKDMPQVMRAKYGIEDQAYDDKRYYVRPSLSFAAKLCRANYDVRTRYERVANALFGLGGAKAKRSFRQERVFVGRKTLAYVLFKGKKLCLTLALNPADYADTKYRGIDVSDKKRFAATPLLIKLTSPRKTDYAVYLIEQLAVAQGLTFKPDFAAEYDFTAKGRDELFASGDVKYAILGEADAEAEQDEDETDAAEENAIRAGILAVNDMSSATRASLGLVGREYDDKRYYVRYLYSFESKLRASTEQIKQRYASLLSEAYRYKKLGVKQTFKGVRLSVGRKTLGQILFKGKTLCLALALNPDDYADTKYRGIDVSDKKRFAATPMLLKLTSERRLGYAMYLLTRVAEQHNLQFDFVTIKMTSDFSAMDVNQLFAAGLIKINLIGEAPAQKK